MSPIREPEPPSRGLLDLAGRPSLASCPSTQSLCLELAARGAPEGTVVWAREQTAGRGRGGNLWHSPPGQGLWLSFLLRPRVSGPDWPALTPLVAVAMCEAIETLPRSATGEVAADDAPAAAGDSPTALGHSPTVLSASLTEAGAPSAATRGSPNAKPRVLGIKWPNDLVGRRGKLGGILAEASREAVVVGVGINLSQCAGDFPPEIAAGASSLWIEGFRDPERAPGRSGPAPAGAPPRAPTPAPAPAPARKAARAPAPETLAARFNDRLTRAYSRFQNGEREYLREGLLRRFFLRGAWVAVDAEGTVTEGAAEDIGERGELVIATSAGPRALSSGRVVRYRGESYWG